MHFGFVFGYVLGAKAGPEKLEELKQAWRAVVESEEFKGLFATATASVQSALAQGGGNVAEQLQRLTAGEGELREAWRRISGGGDLLQAWNRISESGELQRLMSLGTTLIGNALTQARSAAGEQGRGSRA